VRITLVHPAIGRIPGERYLRAWQMEPLPLAHLAGLTSQEHQLSFFDDRLEPIPFDQPTDLAAISVETYTAKRAYQIASEYRKRGVWSDAHAPSWNTCGALSIPVIHVQSVPRYEDLSSRLAIRAVKRAFHYGVSDGGGVLLSDLARYNGSLVLIEKRDHYFRDIPMQALLGRILYWIDYVAEQR
jgi:hypothetical protein